MPSTWYVQSLPFSPSLPLPIAPRCPLLTKVSQTPLAMRLIILLAWLMGVAPTHSCGQGTAGINNVIVFGDSYTDEGRLEYFLTHGVPPPPGLYIPQSNTTASGGVSWPQIAGKQIGAKVYNYAVSGAVCTDFFPEVLPSVQEYESPAFLADVAWKDPKTGTNTLYVNRRADNTVYSLWIGANDLGVNAFLTDSQQAGKSLEDFVECIWPAYDAIYRAGGRKFVLFNVAPLQLAPLYTSVKNGGTGNVPRWPNKESYNTTEYEQKIFEYSTTVNKVFEYGVPFQLLVKKRWPGASFSIFDVHQLITDIYNQPAQYLDPPANAKGYYISCPNSIGASPSCSKTSEHPLSSFLWYDDLHFSPKAHEYIASEFTKVVTKKSKYGIYY
ncbi:carbohydrate esterase family 16 protein [Durotheca rogersii]|uniref:carbohydrate esterase family 16 protein n=1 Tax=Durotheca rogersii TaxID=419775 RepID=UPI00221EF137|nr:carbohydrate esterase family 16 protein [Durotheca rogersii]KAI5860931.1 carbohydrate esterase family 16 protein [Durotheca rogersii]